jgi:hypothetical protein
VAPPVFKSPFILYSKLGSALRLARVKGFLGRDATQDLAVGAGGGHSVGTPTLVRSTLRRSEAIPRRAGYTASNSLHLGYSQ